MLGLKIAVSSVCLLSAMNILFLQHFMFHIMWCFLFKSKPIKKSHYSSDEILP